MKNNLEENKEVFDAELYTIGEAKGVALWEVQTNLVTQQTAVVTSREKDSDLGRLSESHLTAIAHRPMPGVVAGKENNQKDSTVEERSWKSTGFSDT